MTTVKIVNNNAFRAGAIEEMLIKFHQMLNIIAPMNPPKIAKSAAKIVSFVIENPKMPPTAAVIKNEKILEIS